MNEFIFYKKRGFSALIGYTYISLRSMLGISSLIT